MSREQTPTKRLDSRPRIAGRRAGDTLLEIDAWIASETKVIRSLVDQLIRLIELSRCVLGHEPGIELALLEAVTNAVVHGNRSDPHRLVQVRCRCELGRGLSIVVKDNGQGFALNAVPNPGAVENLWAGRGRGIHLMKLAMDEVKFENKGTEVHMWKAAGHEQRMFMRTPGNDPTQQRHPSAQGFHERSDKGRDLPDSGKESSGGALFDLQDSSLEPGPAGIGVCARSAEPQAEKPNKDTNAARLRKIPWV